MCDWVGLYLLDIKWKTPICLIIHWPLKMNGHNYWQAWHHFLFPVDVFTKPEYTLSHIPLCVCSEWMCVGMSVESRPGLCFFMLFWEMQTHLFCFFGMNSYVILSASPCSTLISCQSLSRSEMWNAQTQTLHIHFRESSSLSQSSPVCKLCQRPSCFFSFMFFFFWQNDEVRCRLHRHMKVNLHFQYFLAACECVCICFVKAVRSRW